MNLSPKIALFPEASFGAALNCIGIAQELKKSGASPVFICHPGFTGVFSEYGFKEYHLSSSKVRDETHSESHWEDFLNTHLKNFNLTPFEQLTTYVAPTWEAIVESAIEVEDSLARLLKRLKPDAILLDNVIMFPAIANAGCPWVRVVSCAETEIPDQAVPPYLSGLKSDDTQGARAFNEAYKRATKSSHGKYKKFRKKKGLPTLPAGVFLETSPDLNLLLAPSAVRYKREVALAEEKFVFLEGCVRNESAFEMPFFSDQSWPLVYVSFGSLGALDKDLLAKLMDAFADISARFLVNVGSFLDSYDTVPSNVYLGDWFPQPSVVAQSDLFIHHGGNNSFCEALYYGVPSLVMPYCWDGHDNAQRAESVGLGKHVNRATWTTESLQRTILSLLDDAAMKSRLAKVSEEMRKNTGTVKAAKTVLDLMRRARDN